MRAKVFACSAFVSSLLAVPLFAQTVPNPINPGNFQKYAAPVSGRIAFFASDLGKNTLLNAPNPIARTLLVRYWGDAAGAQWDSTPHKYNGPAGDDHRRPKLQRRRRRSRAMTLSSRCSQNRFNLEAAAGALPQNEESIDFKKGATFDIAGEASNDMRGFFLSEGVWSPGVSGYYFEYSGGCLPQYEGALAPIPDPGISGVQMVSAGDPMITYDANHDSWFYSGIYESPYSAGIGVYRNTNANLSNATACPSGTHNLTTALSCWPQGPAASGFNAVIVDEQFGGFFADKPASWVDRRTSGTGAGDVYVTDTLFGFGSTIHLTACTNDLTACSSAVTVSGSDSSTQFSDVKTDASGNITITYGNFVTNSSFTGPLYSVDIKYVTCTPNGAPNPPTCNAPVLVTREWQPIVNGLTDMTDVRNSTYPTHVEDTLGDTYVVWERCHNFSSLPFNGSNNLTCSQADIMAAKRTGAGWSAPFVIDNTFGHHIQPWTTYDSSLNTVVIAYQNCNVNSKNQCQMTFRSITGGTTTVSAATALSSYAYPEAEANRPFFNPLFGDYIGASAHDGHAWFGYTDTQRFGLYGSPGVYNYESNNNIAAEDGL